MNARILIIEDETDLCELVCMYLEKEGIQADSAGNGETGLDLAGKNRYDLIILDINLPGMDGFEFLQAFRKNNDTPVIIVSARESDEDVVLGLGIGADEVVIKPFAPKVLVARVRAHLRRNRLQARKVYRFGGYTMDPEGYVLFKGSERIVLSSKEFEVLRSLVTRAGKAMLPAEIFGEVWQKEYGDLASVAVYIRRIRAKIEEDPQNPLFVQTIHGKGYRFNPDTLEEGPAR
ncbi:MAG: response regulator transcription factor [Spirochaetales bacterium]|nr:MAG: response regulator transcription factor [Spirochaetales bacterium]